ncbi:uncharacterized protein LOC144112680 isoform X2 [Amblyomma americanum]
MGVPVMTDMCQGGSSHASTPCMEVGVTESLGALQTGFGGNYEDCDEGRGLVPKAVIFCTQTRQEGLSGADSKKEVAFRALQKRCCMVRDERSNRTEGCSGNMVRLGGKMSLHFDGAVTTIVLASAIAFVDLPLLVFLGVMMRHRQSALPLLTDLKMMRDRFAMAAFLYAYDGYSKYLVCLPRTLSHLYGSETCTLPTWCWTPSGRSKEDIFEACAYLYEMLAMSEHAEVIQIHHEKYDPHMRNFVRDNTLGACVWVCALSLAVLVILGMLKMIWGEIAAVVHLYKRYTAERRKGVTRNDAFHAVALALLPTDTSNMEPLLTGKEQRCKVISILGPITASRAVSAHNVVHNQKCPDVNPAVAPEVVDLHGAPESSDALHPSLDNASQSHVLVEFRQTLKPQGAPQHCRRFTGFDANIFLNDAEDPFMSRHQIGRACVVRIVSSVTKRAALATRLALRLVMFRMTTSSASRPLQF